MSITNQHYNQSKSIVQSQKDYHKKGLLISFICLLLVEIITFGINAKHMGIYQDEWIYLGKLHFIPHSLFKILSTCFLDPRIIVRPVEALHFGLLFYFNWENPIWYHIVCYICEFIGAWFLFLALFRYTKNAITALTCALLFLLYPTHDVTHYEIVASSLPLSMAFFTFSLWLYLKSIDESHYSLILWSALAYTLSIYNYEFCLPFVVLYPLLNILTYRHIGLIFGSLKKFVINQLPFFLAAASIVIYRKWLLPSLGLGYNYTTIFDLNHFLSVIWNGLVVNLSPYTLQFCISMIETTLKEGVSIFSWICLSVAVGAIFVALTKEKNILYLTFMKIKVLCLF